HLEYKPLVNARAHALGQRRQIVNARVLEQYHHFMKLLGYHPRLTDEDELAVVYYLLLQDRDEEALATFARVNPEKLTTRLQSDGQFASIRPNATRVVKLPANQAKLAVPLPEDLLKRNVLVEVSAAGKTRAKPYYATAMAVQTTENYGHLRVADAASGKPLPKAYVKVYARLADGSVKFHKDGYTDLRGRFDYATVSTPERQAVERFAVLVLSDERGAVIREAQPPQQ